MIQAIVKSHYTAPELAAMRLPGIPLTEQGVRYSAARESWANRRRVKGKGVEYAFDSLPADVQAEIRHRAAASLVAATPAEDSPLARRERQLDLVETDAQRLRADARKGILTTIERLMAQCRVSREAAMTTLLTQAKAGTADDHIVMMLRAARDERGRKGDGFPSIRSLKRYLGLSKTGSLAPKKPRAEFTVPAWATAFLSIHQVPQNPSVKHSYQQFADAFRMRDREWDFPSIHQVRRFLDKLGNVTREVGRMGPRELKSIRPFIRRTFDQLLPNDVWSADGHTFDAEVQHPLHGRPFRPEITAIIDIATRRATGFSIGLAESSLAVLDGLTNAVTNNGVLAIFYVDRGSGYDNAMIKAEAIGMQGLLGFEVTHSLPYNSQARGVVERFHQSLWIRAAKELPSFIGDDMDRQAKLAHFKITRNAIKNGGALPLMAWEQFMRFCQEQIDKYNARPHSTLPKIVDPADGKRRHMTPDEALDAFRAKGWEPIRLNDAETRSVFRPRVERTVARGEIALFNNRYFSGLLEEFHGERVQIAFDIHDAQRVWVHHMDGRFICTAEFGANQRHYMPMSFVERAREKRADARLKRLDIHRDEIEAERRGAPALTVETADVFTIPGFGDVSRTALDARIVDVQAIDVTPAPEPTVATPVATVIEMPETAEQRFARWQAMNHRISNGGTIDRTDELKWYELYPKSKEFAAQMRRVEEGGELHLAAQR
jgi:putative transposase